MDWYDDLFASKLRYRVLVVGAGGIGCELLKNLVLTGFSNIDVIDLDTISVSNLNRQFLFRNEHVGKPKVFIAAEAVREMASNLIINCHHDTIFSEKYNVDFFRQFAAVMSALDNRAARSHVNRLCLAARVPLIESGSSGYLGQICVIVRDLTECYECQPKLVQQTYPSCTIRNTPSELIHCIVWAKHLFNQLFGEYDADEEVSPDPAYSIDKLESREATPKKLPGGYTANGVLRKNYHIEGIEQSVRKWVEKNAYDPKLLFRKFFHDDILYLLSMSDLWKQRRKPVPLAWENLPDRNPSSSKCEPADDVWSVLECRIHFEQTLKALSERLLCQPVLHWDKDNDDATYFVSACANLRAYAFNIPLKSHFAIKSMAGNIIPAIATTNAIVASMVVVEALKLLSNQLSDLRNVFIVRKPNRRGKILVDELPCKPRPNCIVCSARREIIVKVNVNLTTVKSLEVNFLKGIVNMVAPDVIISGTGKIVISSEAGETDVIKNLTMEKAGVMNGCLLDCDDFVQNFEIRVQVSHFLSLGVDEFEIINDTGEFVNQMTGIETISSSSLEVEKSISSRAAVKRVQLESDGSQQVVKRPHLLPSQNI